MSPWKISLPVISGILGTDSWLPEDKSPIHYLLIDIPSYIRMRKDTFYFSLIGHTLIWYFFKMNINKKMQQCCVKKIVLG
jgi:hypothetical protein